MDIYEKSLEILKKLAESGIEFYLVGGWAIWCYNPYMKSRDIDLIVKERDSWRLRDFLLDLGFRETAKVLEKKGFSMMWGDDKIEIDVYDKRIGKYDIKELMEKPAKRKINGKLVSVISITNLFILKSYTAMERLGTAKGEKDLSDLLALLDAHYKDIEWSKLEIKDLLQILLKDYKQTTRIYPLSLEKYKNIKNYLKKSKKI
jgi:predicted nucleotidyltransferase